MTVDASDLRAVKIKGVLKKSTTGFLEFGDEDYSSQSIKK